MAKEVVAAVVSRKKMKKPIKRMSNGRKLRLGLKRMFNYLKSDSYMFAPLIHPQSSPTISSVEVPFNLKAEMKKKEKKLVEDVNDYLKCDAYLYAPLAMDSSATDGTTTPASGDGCGEDADIQIPVTVKQSERVKHIFHQNYHSLSSTTTGKVRKQD